MTAVDFDERHDLLLVQASDGTTRFYAREQLSGRDGSPKGNPRLENGSYNTVVSGVRYCD